MKPVIEIHEILNAREIVRKVYMDTKIEQYILDISAATRYPQDFQLPDLQSYLRFGTSPRGSINLAKAARVHAFLRKRAFVIPEDIRSVLHDVMRHRIGITYEAEADSVTTDQILDRIVNKIPVP